MKLPVATRAAAIADLLDQFSDLANENPTAARRFLDAVKQTLDVLSSNPMIGGVYTSNHPRLREVRVWIVRGFDKHLVFYRAST